MPVTRCNDVAASVVIHGKNCIGARKITARRRILLRAAQQSAWNSAPHAQQGVTKPVQRQDAPDFIGGPELRNWRNRLPGNASRRYFGVRIHTPHGKPPTGIVLTVVNVAVSITLTLFERPFAT